MKNSTHPFRGRGRLAAGVVLAAAASLALSACGGGDSAAPGSDSGNGGGGGETAVALITKTSTNPFFLAMKKGAEDEAAKQNVKLTYAAGAEDGDEDGQVKAIEAAVARGDQGILITPNGPGVNSAIEQARKQGLYVIALDTPPDPADVVDLTIATNNFTAGEEIGKWAAAKQDGKQANIALLDLYNDKVVSVDYNRDQGFLTGMGIDVKDPKKNGDEDKSGTYTGGKGGSYTIACNEPTLGAQDQGKSAMETCLSKTKDINLVYTLNEPAAAGAAEALDAAGVKATIVSVDGGCSPGISSVKSGVIGATSQQYPVKMAQLGVDAIKKIANGGEKPAVTPGLTFLDSGVALVTDNPVDGLQSITSDEASKICWG
ncbi:monosaccharide ABC transporter substrate-binding protein, CUT2 family [Microlunatus sagamiharensis]|uniref:Monosaccharide ABC transporter substrate-binding protein, CUT2 family n=1 Tax=Microlunatus sagamiharensis TaxID=546874 RepID=A0A1H2MDD3_9ACTN|nr:substrate-binding domain-containing protein [Microlunatus sagamiharensis]SDU90948.1 monosaccharide ABC transporter substrate-binding protein, CUT2 family [Microlunatus sagamiharensis]